MQSGYEGYELTAAAERVLDEAARWAAPGAGHDLAAGALLLGLIAESECRAAQWLRAREIGQEKVLARFPGLERRAEVSAGASIAPAWLRSLVRAAESNFAVQLRPTTVATEHLMLGLLSSDGALAQWLDASGDATKQLAAEISGRQGLALASTSQRVEPTQETDDVLDADEATEPAEADRVAELRVESLETDLEAGVGAAAGLPSSAQLDQTLLDEIAAARDVGSMQRSLEAMASPATPQAVWRILDAAANRAGEGLRVVEDFARFALEDRRLVAELKSLRHDLRANLSRLPAQLLLAARDTPGDVGTTISTAAEQTRADLAAVVTANCNRAAEALRSLEEYTKLVDPGVATEFERLRYRVYTLAKTLGAPSATRVRLAEARLYVLIDGCVRGAEGAAAATRRFERLVAALVDAQVDVLQLRDKSLTDVALLDRARRLRALTRGTTTLAIVNDRADIAAASDADGVHVGQDELSVADARAIVGPQSLVGVSTHSIEQAEAAVRAGADYIGVGPTFPSATKEFADYPGLTFLREVAQRVALPAFAIGGITLDNLDEVLTAGIRRVAVRDAIAGAAEPAAAAQAFRERLFAR
ncbi:MAG: thiamine phosphate synthase [Pirellulales bacterium]|nr:thiamine phosphate synthase [Pirellulales bacterium]